MIGTILLLAGHALAALPPPDYRDELGERLAAEVSALTEQGRYDEAVERGEQIVDQVEPFVPVLYEIAFAHRLAGEDRAAMRAYDRCVEADPDHAAADAYEVFDLLGDGVATPSVFIVDADGYVVWSYVGQHAADRPGADTILSHLPDQE